MQLYIIQCELALPTRQTLIGLLEHVCSIDCAKKHLKDEMRQGQILSDVRKMLDEYGPESAQALLAGRESEKAMCRLQGNQVYQLVPPQIPPHQHTVN